MTGSAGSFSHPLGSEPLVASAASLVFFHGWGSKPSSYEGSLSEWEGMGVRVHAPALPGHGGERPLPLAQHGLSGLSLWAAETARPFAAQGHLVLAGHSLGGALASLACRDLVRDGLDCSLMLLSSAGANPVFGLREWVRACQPEAGERPRSLRQSWQSWRYPLRHPLHTARIGWEARTSNLLDVWDDLLDRGVRVTAVHSHADHVVDTSPFLQAKGVATAVISAPHSWPEWMPHLSSMAALLHFGGVSALPSSS